MHYQLLRLVPLHICVGSTSFTIPYTATSGSPDKYSISGAGITTVADATLNSSPITVNLSAPASAARIFYIHCHNSAASCASTDVNGSVIATQPTVSLVSSAICVGGSTTASPSSGGTWISNNPSIPTITDAGVITAGSTAGTATFTFTESGPNGCSNTTSLLTVDATCQVITLTEPDGLKRNSNPYQCNLL